MTDFAQVAEFLEQIVVRTPGATAAGMLAQLHGCRDTATCARCGREIFTYGGGGDWRHAAPGFMRGCRSASFDDGQYSWDESLRKEWKATPAAERPAPGPAITLDQRQAPDGVTHVVRFTGNSFSLFSGPGSEDPDGQ